jgi:hypothetical protein
MLSFGRLLRLCFPAALSIFILFEGVFWAPLLAETRKPRSEVHLSNPRGICVANDGYIYVASPGNDSVAVLTEGVQPRYQGESNGPLFVAEGQIVGLSGGELKSPTDVAVDAAGRVIVADTGNDLVKIYENLLDERRYSVEVIRGSWGRKLFSGPEGVTVDEQGNIIVFDTGNSKVQIYSPRAKLLATIEGRPGQEPPDFHTHEQKPQPFLSAPIAGCYLGKGYLAVADRRLSTYSLWRYAPESPQSETCQFIGYGPPGENALGFYIRDIAYNSQRRYLAFIRSNFPLRDASFLYFQAVDAEDPGRLAGGNVHCSLRVPLMGWLENPAGLASNLEGDLFITDAATHSFQRISRESFTVLNSPVSVDAQQTRATLKYFSTAEVFTELEFGAVPVSIGPDVSLGRVYSDPARLFAHTVRLSELLPSTRYAYRFLLSRGRFCGASGKCLPNFSKTRFFATKSAPRTTEYLDFPLTLLLFPNVDTESIRSQLESARLFFWVNSRMTCNIKPEFVSVSDGQKMPDLSSLKTLGGEAPGLEKLLGSLRNLSSSRSLFVIAPAEAYDKNIQGLLPMTCGLDRLGGAVSFFAYRGKEDTTWSCIKEYHKQLSIMHLASGRNDALACLSEAPDSDLSAVLWDSLADISRALGRQGWLANRYGVLQITADNDEDGIPDDDPNCPLDEKRFGTSPRTSDTDNDGVRDLREILTSRWAKTFPVQGARAMANQVRLSPLSADTDRDGVEDSVDRNPLCPLEDEVRRLDVVIDGKISQGEWDNASLIRIADPEYTGVLRVAWSRTHLCFSLTGSGQGVSHGPPSIRIRLDGAADGLLRGSDNVSLVLEPAEDGTFTIRQEAPSFGFAPVGCPFSTPAWSDLSRVVAVWKIIQNALQVEVGLPKSREVGLNLFAGEEVGFDFELSPKGSSFWLRVMEPLALFRGSLLQSPEQIEMPD